MKDSNGKDVALFIGDYFARPSKHSGAWMSAYRDQQKLDGAILPIIVNVMNFAKAGAGEPCLLSFDDARTLFHEFGHGLHGMLSDVTYPLLSGTAVPRDFVEFPSQLYEHWFERPEILRRFAVHYRSGEPMPEALLQRLLAARQFNQGFATVEFTASALVDLDVHLEASPGAIDIVAFEKKELEKLGMPAAIQMRHRTPHFQHIFAGSGYSAGYYSYLWSEIPDAVTGPGSLRGKRRRGLTRPSPHGCATTSTPPATAANPTPPMPPSAAARRGRRRCCASAGWRRRAGSCDSGSSWPGSSPQAPNIGAPWTTPHRQRWPG